MYRLESRWNLCPKNSYKNELKQKNWVTTYVQTEVSEIDTALRKTVRVHALSFEPAPVKKERGFQFTVHEEGEKRLPAWALLICPHVLFPRLPIRCALEDQLSSRIHDSENLEILEPANPRIRNLGTRNPGIWVRRNPKIRNLGTKTWVPGHGNAGTRNMGTRTWKPRSWVTRTWAFETRTPGTWSSGNLENREPGNVGI